MKENKLSLFFKTLWQNISHLFKTQPITVVLLLAGAVLMTVISKSNGESSFTEPLNIQWAIACFSGAVFAFLMHTLSKRFNLPSLIAVLSAAPVFVVGLTYEETPTFAAKIAIYSLICFIVAILLETKESDENFSDYLYLYVKSAFRSAVYAGVICLGLIALLGAYNLLINNLGETIFANIAIYSLGFLLPIFFLSYIGADKEFKQIRFVTILINYILIPLFFGFFLVFLLYIVKILINGKLPVGELGPIVLAFSLSGFILYFLSYNLDEKISKALKAVFPYFIIVSVVLQLYSVMIRLNAYGITESRYFLTLFAIFSIIGSILLIIRRNFSQWLLPVVASVMLAVSLVPPVDMTTVSMKSQLTRLNGYLTQNEMLKDGRVIPKTDVPIADRKEITSIVSYLQNTGKLDKQNLVPLTNKTAYEDFEKTFGFPQWENYPSEDGFQSINITASPEMIDVSGYVNLYELSLQMGDVPKSLFDGKVTTSSEKDGDLIIKFGSAEFSLSNYIKALDQAMQKTELPQSTLTITLKSEIGELKILLKNISVEFRADKISYGYFNAILLYK